MLKNGGVSKSPEYESHSVHSCDADDEETHERVAVYDDQPLDMTCKKDARKRALESDDQGSAEGNGLQDPKKLKCSGAKRKLLRKKRYHKRVSDVQVSRPSVISFAGSSGNYTSSSSNEEPEEDDSRARRRKKMNDRKKLFVHADVEEHFRRSLGGVLYDLVNKQEKNEESRNSIHSSAGDPQDNFVAEVIRPSDVDDHFAKALGTETWSKIVKNSRGVNSSSSTPPLQEHRTTPPAAATLNPTPPPTIVSKTSNSYKIESILGTSVSASERPTIKQPPVYDNTRRSPPPPYTTTTS
ncbi:Transcription cofactor vestigial-like protein 4 [Orchesella cincta]|uniref:Transcription cofactor vestigial-like protein 4 n=1 Tax=Orchesella cincta TaxID=48709 RepID=A0A1D2MC80_ORCCI|nr:Transcription cofactor vestigial-like protein 4 [Orchesella cincta]